MTDDADLLRDYAETGSNDAFAELVRRHVDLVFSAALRQVGGDAHLAHDVAQTVFLDLSRKARALAGRTSLVGWLYTSATYAAANVVRGERRRRARERAAHAMSDDATPPRDTPDWDRLRPHLDAAMLQLNATDREAVLLRFFSQRSFPEIGAALRSSSEAARKRVDRALEKLRDALTREGLACTSATLALTLTQNAVAAAPAGASASIAKFALAGTAVASVTPAGVSVFLMSKIKFASAVVLLGALGVAWLVETRARDETRATNEEIRAQLRHTSARLDEARQRRERPGNAREPSVALAMKPVSLPPLDSGVHEARARSQLDTDYAPLFRQLHLGADEFERLKDLLVQRALRIRQAQKFAFDATGRGMDEWANKTEEIEFEAVNTHEIDDQIRQLLGDARFAEFATHVRTLPWRKLFVELEEQLAPLEPLHDAQVTQLAVWTAATNPELFDDRRKGGTRIPDEVIHRAQTLLSPLQHEKLLQFKEASEAYREMLSRTRLPPAADSPAAVRTQIPPAR